MGNCLRRESEMQWGGDDWGSPDTERRFPKGKEEEGAAEEGLLLGEKGRCLSSFATTEVKIKITKKQLEELLGRVDVKELTAEQVLKQLIDAGDRYENHERSWRPALQSIPE